MFRLIGTVHAVAVELAGRYVGQVAVPDVVAAIRQREALELAPPLGIEQAQIDLLGIGREQGKVGSPPIPCCTQGMRLALLDAHSNLRNEEQRSERREREAELGMLAVHYDRDRAAVADVAAAVDGGIRIQDLAPIAIEGNLDAIVASHL